MILTKHNITKEGEEFYISYNPVDVANYGCVTTAIVKQPEMVFYILNGNHRDALNALIPEGFDKCVEYFKKHKNEINYHSQIVFDKERNEFVDKWKEYCEKNKSS